jgi:hypothetical protein
MSSRRRTLLLAVAGLLSASALLAVGILLFGDFGRSETRILGTTALLGCYGLLAVPAAMLGDRGRARPLAAAVVALAAAAAALALAAVWWGDPPETLGKSIGTATLVLLAATQTAILVARRSARDPRSVQLLLRASIVLGSATAGMWIALVWAGDRLSGVLRLLAAVAVLDGLTVALQPLLARARPRPVSTRLRLRLSSGAVVDRDVAAADVGAAVAQAIRSAEHDGVRVDDVAIVERAQKS